MQSITRRGFIGAAAAASLGASTVKSASGRPAATKPANEVWVGSIGLMGLGGENPAQRIQQGLKRLNELVSMKPDIVCLPEVFPVMNSSGKGLSMEQSSEKPIGEFSRPFAEFARKHQCYVIFPTYTKDGSRYYNAAVVIDRNGQYVGEYRKINPTDGEIEHGVTPGPSDPPVFQTDFGTIGIQICFDVNWHENWTRLREKGAKMVFWPSAFAGGEMLNGLAWHNKYYVVGSTGQHPLKIVDPIGDDVVSTGRFGDWVCRPLNLNYEVVQGWQDIGKLDTLVRKYGREFTVRTKHVEAWSLVEGHGSTPVSEVLREYDIQTSNEMLARNTELQNSKRP